MPLAVKITAKNSAEPTFLHSRSHTSFPITIGRRSGLHVELPFSFISSLHAEISCDRFGGLVLRDLGANNPFIVNGTPVPPDGAVTLLPGQKITVGPVEIHLDFEQSTSGVLQDEVDTAESSIQSTVSSLRSRHDELERARRVWMKTLSGALRDEDLRERLEARVVHEFPEKDWSLMIRRSAVLLDNPIQSALVGHLQQVAPSIPSPIDPNDALTSLSHIVEALQVFATSSLALHRSLNRQYQDLGDSSSDPDDVFSHQTADSLISQLVDWQGSPSARTHTLTRSLLAQVQDIERLHSAALDAITELLVSLSPGMIERNTSSRWPTRASALWRSYTSLYSALVGESHKNISTAVQEAISEAMRRGRQRTQRYEEQPK